MTDEVLCHLDAVGELAAVPGEVLLAVRVLYVQPHHVHRDVEFVKLRQTSNQNKIKFTKNGDEGEIEIPLVFYLNF